MAGGITNNPGRLAPLSGPPRPENAAQEAIAQEPIANGERTLGMAGDTGFDPAPSAASVDLTELGDLAKAPTAPGSSFSLSDLGDLGLGEAPRTPEKARAEAEAVWSDHQDWKSDYRQIEKDFRDVNAPVDTAQAKAANDQIAANQELETQALGNLDPAQKAAYNRVRQLTEKDPPARLAMQVLLLEGKLTGGKKSSDGKDLLGELDRMATKPLNKSIDRSALVSDLLQEVAAPSSINQRNRPSCIFTSLQIQMVLQRPAEYARLVGGLASPDGKVKLANGETLSRYRNAEKADDTNRSISTRLWTTGLMAHGAPAHLRNNPKITIDAAADFSRSDNVIPGLGGKADFFMGLNPMAMADRKDEMISRFKALTDQGTPVQIGLAWGEGGQEHALHQVMVTGIKDDRAYYTNPWGTEESMPVEELKQRMSGLPKVVTFD